MDYALKSSKPGTSPPVFLRLTAIVVGLLAIASCKNEPATPSAEASDTTLSVNELVKPPPGPTVPNTSDPATTLVQVHCSRCHVLPDPAQLSKKLWVNKVLPEMGCYLGMQHHIPQYLPFVENGNTAEEAQLFKSRALYPNQALIKPQEWDLIVGWFLKNSPETLPQSNNVEPPTLPQGKFEASFIGPRNPSPESTLLKIDTANHRFITSDATKNTLTLHDQTGNILSSTTGPSPFTVARLDSPKLGQQFIAVGTLIPNDSINGSLWTAPTGEKFGTLTQSNFPLLKRPVAAVWHDLDQDGREEIVVAEYGNKTGQLSLFHQESDDTWHQVTLNQLSGNIAIKVSDMNHDGMDDLIVLRAQETEDLLIYYNTGDLKFLESHVLKFPPYWGSSSFDLDDLNKDGHLDLILANGDNADNTPVLKNFHGVHIFFNDKKGGFNFKQTFPFHGAYGVRALDYDLDGDLDLICFSTFPDFQSDQASIRIIEQTAPLAFKTYSIPQSKSSRWIVMDVGDLDGDGDQDILFGANIPSPSAVPELIENRAKSLPGSFLLLKNLTNN